MAIQSNILFLSYREYHYACCVIYFAFYFFIYLFVSIYLQWKIKNILSRTQMEMNDTPIINKIQLSVDDFYNDSNTNTKEKISLKKPKPLSSSPSTSKNIFFNEKILKKQSVAKAWSYSLIHKHNIYRHILVELIVKSLHIGTVLKLFLIYNNMDMAMDKEYNLIKISLYASLSICILYKIISCITMYIISYKCIDIVYELLNLTLLRCLYVNYRLYTKETSAPQRFIHLLHSSLKTSSLLIIFCVLLIETDNKRLRHDLFIICCIFLSFMSLLSSIISNDTNIMKNHWKYSQFDCTACRLDIKYLCRSLLWRFSEITFRILLLLLLYISFSVKTFIILISVEFFLNFTLFFFNRSVLCLGSILFYHVTCGKYFGGGTVLKNIGYYIFVLFSIYRFLSSFIYLLLLTIKNYSNVLYPFLIYEWATFVLWILCMFYVTEKGSKAVYNDQLLAPLAIYQQFVQLLDFIVFGADITDLIQHKYDYDAKNIIQYLCAASATNHKYALQTEARLDIIRNICFKKYDIYKQFVFETNDKNQTCLYYAVIANQLDIVRFLVQDQVRYQNDNDIKMDINRMDDNDQTVLHVAIERSYNGLIKYMFLECQDLDMTLKDVMNRTYLHFAAMSQSMQITKYFAAYKLAHNQDSIDFAAVDDYGKSMLFYVENLDLIKYLLDRHDLDVNAVDFDGKTVLFDAMNANKMELTKYLIEECNIDCDVRDNDGNLAFFYCRTIEAADYMINKCNMDCNVVNDDGQSVIFNAISSHYNGDLCRYYIETCNINIKQVDKYNKTLIDVAVEYLNIAQVQYLINKLFAMNHRQTIYKSGVKKASEPKKSALFTVNSTNALEGEFMDEEYDDIDDDVINIKTWICAKDKLISSLYDLFSFGYNVNNIMNGVNKKNGNIHNIHYIVGSMYYVDDSDEKLTAFGLEIIQNMILKNNKLIDIEDDDKKTTLYYCIDSEVYELVILFVENGANLYHLNIFRESPLEYAIQKCKCIQIREYLTETRYNSPFANIPHKSNDTTDINVTMDGNEEKSLVEMVSTSCNEDIPSILLQKTIGYLSQDTYGLKAEHVEKQESECDAQHIGDEEEDNNDNKEEEEGNVNLSEESIVDAMAMVDVLMNEESSQQTQENDDSEKSKESVPLLTPEISVNEDQNGNIKNNIDNVNVNGNEESLHQTKTTSNDALKHEHPPKNATSIDS